MAATTVPPVRTARSAAREESRGNAGFFEYAGVAVDSLRANKLRSFLTLLGIIIGVMAIIAVISLIQGFDRYWKQKVSNLGPNSFVVTQFPIITDPERYYELLRRNPEIHAEDAEAIRRYCTSCEQVGVEIHKEVRVRYGNQAVEGVDMSGITPSVIDIEPYEVEAGRNLLEWENDHSQFVTFVGWEIADRLFAGADPVGKSIYIQDHWYRIVGVAEKRGSFFGFSRDNFVKIPLSTFQKIYGTRRSGNIPVKARPGEIQQAQDQARMVMRTLHRLDYDDEDDFGIITSEGLNQLFNDLTRIIFSVSLFVVGVSLVVGGIVIMNIMLVSVLERTKEIGIRKAVGARQQDVVNQFLVEAVVLCCAGGAVGIACAYGISWAIARFTPIPSVFPLWAPLLGFFLCAIIGMFFGIYPARRAGKLDPIEALRAE
jgi:putative ABC transport system permease protein